jgi:hypothetical protein
MRSLALVALTSLGSLAAMPACAGDGGGLAGPGSGGATGASGTTTVTATATATASTGGDPIPCDYEGVCGDNVEPACQGCALETECSAELMACQEEPADACIDLNKCRVDCPDDANFDACIAACDAQFPAGVGLLQDLLVCVFCGACPVSCATEPEDCPL